MKKVLMVATTAAMTEQFNKSNIHILQEMGYEVHVAGNIHKGNPISRGALDIFQLWMQENHVQFYHIDATRNPLDLINNHNAYKLLLEIIDMHHYEFIHCHTPIGSILARKAGRKTNTPVIYTAHGFHFFKGAPLINWLLYYPVEWFFSFRTQMLVTINREDYKLAKKHMHAKDIRYIPGVGVRIDRFKNCVLSEERIAEWKEFLNIPEGAYILLSVGELSKRKNHIAVMNALRKLNNPDIYYLIVGYGPLREFFFDKIAEYDMENQVQLLGYRDDVQQLCKYVDCFIHPSIREGLGLAPLEAMASGLPLISADINGMKDYTEHKKTGLCVRPKSVKEIAAAIDYMYTHRDFAKACGEYNQTVAEKYDIKKSSALMREIYADFVKKYVDKK